MSTLRLEFDIGLNLHNPADDDSLLPIVLHRLTSSGESPDGPSLSETFYVRQGNRIHRGRAAHVWAGKMQKGDGRLIDIVLKITIGRDRHVDLIKEANFYQNELAAVQGNIVPRFYGIFQGHIRTLLMTCMVLEHCGEHMTKAQHEDMDFKVELISRLGYLHSICGVEHGDVCSSNILVKDGFPVIIDFECAQPHRCERKMTIEVGKPWPPVLDFGCFELYDVARDFELWGPAIVEFLDDCISVRQITSAKQLVDLTLHNDYTDRAKALEDAQELVQYLVGMGTLPESVLMD
ncbi:hypothetical protein SCP_0410490 [Sparassis crispa]|uniref:Protein kinase domain-containing protein n=1 Tax=Sparassis crispa TaxID=139825 RepID=A0A401GKJ8_9APHY|nr:hypothetical protein SCP_0410490 [Sparassis crispa]GBE82664.1 hypothetical protein SCP_0410490 [Sparassis crispa]